jgi:hypothetical protein
MDIIKETGIDYGKRKFISKLYMDQGVNLKLDRGETSSVKTGRIGRQGCCLSPILFNFTANTLPKKLLKGLETSE